MDGDETTVAAATIMQGPLLTVQENGQQFSGGQPVQLLQLHMLKVSPALCALHVLGAKRCCQNLLFLLQSWASEVQVCSPFTVEMQGCLDKL